MARWCLPPGAALLVLLACFLLPASGEDVSNPEIMAGATVELCEGDSRECWANDGPHPVIGYDTNGLDPATMRVRLELDGNLLLHSAEASQEVTVLMRSPHEFPPGAIKSDSHAVRAQIVARSDSRLLAVNPTR